MNKEEILSEIARCDRVIQVHGGDRIEWDEAWHWSVRGHKPSFDMLLKAERSMIRNMKSYLEGLSERIPTLIDYDEYRTRSIKAYDLVVDVDSSQFESEAVYLHQAMTDPMSDAIAAGVLNSEFMHGIVTGMSRNSEMVLKAARMQAGAMVSDVLPTTRKRINQALETGLSLGEDNAAVTSRIQKLINDPVRADMIARTEAVNSFAIGVEEYGLETGAESETWITVQIGPCKLCAALSGMTVPIGEDFPSLIGPIRRPAAHPRCRCRKRLNYPKTAESPRHSNRPEHEIQIEDAMNRGDYAAARRIVQGIPETDDYRKSMESMLDTLIGPQSVDLSSPSAVKARFDIGTYEKMTDAARNKAVVQRFARDFPNTANITEDMEWRVERVKLKDLQVWDAAIDSKVDEYKQAMAKGDTFPSIMGIRHTGSTSVNALDGAHRAQAVRELGVEEIEMLVGTPRRNFPLTGI